MFLMLFHPTFIFHALCHLTLVFMPTRPSPAQCPVSSPWMCMPVLSVPRRLWCGGCPSTCNPRYSGWTGTRWVLVGLWFSPLQRLVSGLEEAVFPLTGSTDRFHRQVLVAWLEEQQVEQGANTNVMGSIGNILWVPREHAYWWKYICEL